MATSKLTFWLWMSSHRLVITVYREIIYELFIVYYHTPCQWALMKRCWHYVPASSWFLFEVNSLFGLHFLFVSLFSFPFWSWSCPPVSFSPNLDELFHPIGNHKKSKSPVGFQYFWIIRRFFATVLKNFTGTNKKFLEKNF